MFLFLPVAAAACVSLNFVSFANKEKRVDSHADFLLLLLFCFCFFFCSPGLSYL